MGRGDLYLCDTLQTRRRDEEEEEEERSVERKRITTDLQRLRLADYPKQLKIGAEFTVG